MSDGKYTMKVFPDKFGLDTQRVRIWLNEGYVTASHKSEGQGKKAFFTVSDLYRVALFVKLLEKGFKRDLAGEYLQGLRERPAEFVDKVSYLFFITQKTGEESTVDEKSVMGFDVGVNLGPDYVAIGGGGKEGNECDWEDVLILNYAKIRGGVDELLKE